MRRFFFLLLWSIAFLFRLPAYLLESLALRSAGWVRSKNFPDHWSKYKQGSLAYIQDRESAIDSELSAR